MRVSSRCENDHSCRQGQWCPVGGYYRHPNTDKTPACQLLSCTDTPNIESLLIRTQADTALHALLQIVSLSKERAIINYQLKLYCFGWKQKINLKHCVTAPATGLIFQRSKTQIRYINNKNPSQVWLLWLRVSHLYTEDKVSDTSPINVETWHTCSGSS